MNTQAKVFIFWINMMGIFLCWGLAISLDDWAFGVMSWFFVQRMRTESLKLKYELAQEIHTKIMKTVGAWAHESLNQKDKDELIRRLDQLKYKTNEKHDS